MPGWNIWTRNTEIEPKTGRGGGGGRDIASFRIHGADTFTLTLRKVLPSHCVSAEEGIIDLKKRARWETLRYLPQHLLQCISPSGECVCVTDTFCLIKKKMRKGKKIMVENKRKEKNRRKYFILRYVPRARYSRRVKRQCEMMASKLSRFLHFFPLFSFFFFFFFFFGL